jgi:hypothetical protein
MACKHDLNPAVNIMTAEKVCGGHEHPLVSVVESTDFSGHFSFLLSCFISWYVVSV